MLCYQLLYYLLRGYYFVASKKLRPELKQRGKNALTISVLSNRLEAFQQYDLLLPG